MPRRQQHVPEAPRGTGTNAKHGAEHGSSSIRITGARRQRCTLHRRAPEPGRRLESGNGSAPPLAPMGTELPQKELPTKSAGAAGGWVTSNHPAPNFKQSVGSAAPLGTSGHSATNGLATKTGRASGNNGGTRQPTTASLPPPRVSSPLTRPHPTTARRQPKRRHGIAPTHLVSIRRGGP